MLRRPVDRPEPGEDLSAEEVIEAVVFCFRILFHRNVVQGDKSGNQKLRSRMIEKASRDARYHRTGEGLQDHPSASRSVEQFQIVHLDVPFRPGAVLTNADFGLQSMD